MKYRAGYVGLIGQPNAGKSTLLNALVGEKVAIVSKKPQTTRRRVVGLRNFGNSQSCFVDAPGIIRAEKGLNKFLGEEVTGVLKDCDVLVGVLSLDEKSIESLLSVADLIKDQKKPFLFVITKCDLPLTHRLPILREKLTNYGAPIVMVRALTEPEELENELLPLIETMLPESPGPLYDQELYTPHATRDLAGELIREQCFEHLHDEIPFGLAVRLRQFDESKPNLLRVEADVVVAKENHKPMVIGQGGQKLKTISMAARKSVESLVGKQVYLRLHVAVRTRWMENVGSMKEFGYVSTNA